MNLFAKSPWIRPPWIKCFFFGWALLLAALNPAVTSAQDSSSSNSSSSSQQNSDAKPAGRTGTAIGSISDYDGPDQVPVNSNVPPIQELGRGDWLGPHSSPLHWGSLYIGSVTATGSEDHFTSTNPGALVGTVYSSVFQSSVVYNPELPHADLALQWHPQFGFVNGQFADNLDNQDVGFDFGTSLTRRVGLSFHDHFSAAPAQSVFATDFLYGSQTVQNQPAQGAFLDGPGKWLTDTASIALTYGLSPINSLTFSPSFNYSRQTGTFSSANGIPPTALAGSNEYSGMVTWNHKVSLLRNFGLFYTFSALKFQTVDAYVQYHTIGFTYSQRLRPSLFMNVSLGASDVRNPNDVASSWTTSAAVDFEKQFQKSSATLVYSRGLSLNQYASQNLTDRVDFNYNRQLFWRLTAAIGGGYQRVNGPPVISGKYGTAQLSYRLMPNVSVLASYVYRFQVGDAVQVFTETRNSAFMTISWDPMHKHQR